ncbi:alpha/beta hydrolase [Sphingomonas sp. RB1R13]|uniref:alpha/beta hydrolase n=1 Tax=Sphingomonas sp. RB1R13 TaxID=3096159 RepID=UPI002FCBEE57
MTTRHLVDPELLAMADNFPAMMLSDESLPAIRASIAAMLAAVPLPDLPVVSSDIHIPSGDGDRTVRCLLVRPVEIATSAPAILHFHGGGHVLGVPEMDAPMLHRWSHELGCLILSVDYRLAPETPAPGPMDDAYAALAWLNAEAAALGIDPARVAVSGTSAGGSMAAGLALLARDRGEYAIAFQHLDQPRLDDRLPDNPSTGEFVWTRDNSAWCRAALGGQDDPYAHPARATSLTGLPPAFIGVGALDLFVDECLAYTARLSRAGVAVELIVYPGAFHGFTVAAGASVAVRANEDGLRALRRAFAA